ncbi:MAG: hypothetical protein ACR2FG_02790 [Marmoricola sp.]
MIALALVVTACSPDSPRSPRTGSAVQHKPVPGTPTLDWFDTAFGATLRPHPGDSGRQALERFQATIGTPQVVRLYSPGLPPGWGDVRRQVGDLPTVISFKADPQEVLAGSVDQQLRHWFAAAPRDRLTYWVYYHEPEDQVEAGDFSATDFRKAWEHIARLADDAHNPALVSTIVLMCWTVSPASGRDWHDFVPAAGVDMLAWDCYNHRAASGAYSPPLDLLGTAALVSQEAGAQWGVAELGSKLATGDDGSGRAEWLREVGVYARQHGARFVTYFDSTVGGDFQLSDTASQQALGDLFG